MSSYWLLWIGGGVVGTAGLFLLYWSLLADRSRGRMRCPKCWYDMRGVAADPPFRCPECGKLIKHKRKLFKTCRRWRWAMVSVLILIISAGLMLWPKIHRGDWASITPSTVLILLIEFADPDTAFAELDERIMRSIDSPEGIFIDDALWDWQWKLLENRCAHILETSSDGFSNGGRMYMAYFHLGMRPVRCESTVDSLIECIGSNDDRRIPAIKIISWHAGEDALNEGNMAKCLDAMLPLLHDEDPEFACFVLRRIARMGMPRDRVVAVLLSALRSEDIDSRVCACEAIGRFDGEFPEAVDPLLEATEDADAGVRASAGAALGDLRGETDEAVPALIRLLSDEDTWVRWIACNTLYSMGDAAHEAIGALEIATNDTDPDVREAAEEAIRNITADR